MLTVLSASQPVSSGEIPAMDLRRAHDVDHKHQLLAEYLHLRDLDALLLQDPANFSWLTCGGDCTRHGGEDSVAALLVTPEARVVLCNNVDSGQLFDRQLAGLGFLLKERPWTQDLDVLRQDCCRGREIAGDVWFPGTNNVSQELREFRLQPTECELELIRELGLQVAHAVEATCRNFEPGATEADVAGHVAHRLLKHRIEPARIQVLADVQGWRYRHWSYGGDRIERHCIVSATGRRQGLHTAVTRTVCLGAPSDELQETHHLAALVEATGLYFTQPGWPMSETWKRVARIYEKYGVPDEWRQADQAEITGYRRYEDRLVPEGTRTFQAGHIVHWHPSVRSAMAGDTILVTDSGFELLTPSSNWPLLGVQVKGTSIELPGILIRECPGQPA